MASFEVQKRLEVRFVGVQRGFLSERKGKVIPCRRAELIVNVVIKE